MASLEVNHKPVETCRKGTEVCLKIEAVGGEAPRLYGRHFDHTDLLVSKVRIEVSVCCYHFHSSASDRYQENLSMLSKTTFGKI